MFKSTALITMLVVGLSASVAIASPSQWFDSRGRVERTRIERDHDRLGHRDPLDRTWTRRGAGDDFGPRRYRPTWVALDTSLQLARTGETSIEVRDRGTFTQLRLQTTGGAAWIDRVIVRFADGSRQVAGLDRVLGHRGDLLEIELDGNNRRIDRIIVLGDGDRRGALQVFGI